MNIEPEFVEFIPNTLQQGKLYISIKYATASHSCCCGCGSKVVTPLSPIRWSLVYDGRTVSLWPSIGNWALKCKSHYWIRKNKVIWAEEWTDEEIEASRKFEKQERGFYFRMNETGSGDLEVNSRRSDVVDD